MKLTPRSQVLALLALSLLATTAQASSRSIRGGISSTDARSNSEATSNQSDRLSNSSRDEAAPEQGLMRRSRSGFGDSAATTSEIKSGSRTHNFVRNGETIVSLTTESSQDQQSVKISIEGIIDADKHEFLKALKAEIQNNVSVRASITLNAISDDSAPRTRFATAFYITTGMRHRMTAEENTAIFQAADQAANDLLENVTVTVEEHAKPVPTGRRRF